MVRRGTLTPVFAGSSPAEAAKDFVLSEFASSLVVNEALCAIVNGSNSANKFTIEVPQGESVPIECSAQKWSFVDISPNQNLLLWVGIP